VNTSDPALHQEGVGTSDDAAHGGTPPCTGSALPYEPYVFWRFRYYVAHGGMTYRDIDIAVDRGEIKQGDMPNAANEPRSDSKQARFVLLGFPIKAERKR
jgi:hypothetical protein